MLNKLKYHQLGLIGRFSNWAERHSYNVVSHLSRETTKKSEKLINLYKTIELLLFIIIILSAGFVIYIINY